MSTIGWVSKILAERPHRGAGLHRWLLRASIALRRYGLDDQKIEKVIAEKCVGEPVRDGEIEEAVARSVDCMDDDPGTRPAATSAKTANRRASTSEWPKLDITLRSQVVAATDITVAALWEASPVHFDDDLPHTHEILPVLFPGNPLICTACKLECSVTKSLSQIQNLALLQFIVPSPMSAATGMTKSGKPSSRSLDNTGPRQYLVVEQDSGEPDEQSSIIVHLSNYAPLVLVVHSGGKSLHAWFACHGQPETTVRRFFTYAVQLGADPATWTRCQLVRMPDGTRRTSEGLKRQSVLFWNRESARCNR